MFLRLTEQRRTGPHTVQVAGHRKAPLGVGARRPSWPDCWGGRAAADPGGENALSVAAEATAAAAVALAALLLLLLLPEAGEEGRGRSPAVSPLAMSELGQGLPERPCGGQPAGWKKVLTGKRCAGWTLSSVGVQGSHWLLGRMQNWREKWHVTPAIYLAADFVVLVSQFSYVCVCVCHPLQHLFQPVAPPGW